MTEEEIADITLAEAWAGENGFNSDCNNINSVEANRELVNAFLAGLKAKAQWHDLRKNPDDLPKEEKDYLVYTKNFGIEIRNYYSDTKEFSCRPLRIVIAWCELPTFNSEV